MKTYSVITCCMLMAFVSTAQSTHALDTILVNDKMNVALFFPEYIRQGITGSEDFVFSYNREKKQYFGLLQGRPGQESNLLAVTGDGQVYAYILKYSDTLSKLNYFISKSESIGHEAAKLPVENKVPRDDNAIPQEYKAYESLSTYLLKKKFTAKQSKRKHGVVLKLLETWHYNDVVYVVVALKNKSKIDFELEYLNVYKVSATKKRKASYQKLKLDPVYNYNYPSMVAKGKSKSFVLVLPKFTLGDNQRLQIELIERNGSRRVILIY